MIKSEVKKFTDFPLNYPDILSIISWATTLSLKDKVFMVFKEVVGVIISLVKANRKKNATGAKIKHVKSDNGTQV